MQCITTTAVWKDSETSLNLALSLVQPVTIFAVQIVASYCIGFVGVPGSKLLSYSNIDSASHPSKVDQKNTGIPGDLVVL